MRGFLRRGVEPPSGHFKTLGETFTQMACTLTETLSTCCHLWGRLFAMTAERMAQESPAETRNSRSSVSLSLFRWVFRPCPNRFAGDSIQRRSRCASVRRLPGRHIQREYPHVGRDKEPGSDSLRLRPSIGNRVRLVYVNAERGGVGCPTPSPVLA